MIIRDRTSPLLTWTHVPAIAKTLAPHDDACVAAGGRCKHECACNPDTANPLPNNKAPRCNSPFQERNQLLFGSAYRHVRATDCFNRFVEEIVTRDYRDVSFSKPTGELDANTTIENLENLLLEDRSFFSNDKAFGEWRLGDWREQFGLLPKDSEERKVNVQWLLRYGLSRESDLAVNVPHHFFSFCERKWSYSGDTWHCAYCNKCKFVSRTWHCGNCKKCWDGLFKPCEGCGGRSLRDPREYPTAADEMLKSSTPDVQVIDITDDTSLPVNHEDNGPVQSNGHQPEEGRAGDSAAGPVTQPHPTVGYVETVQASTDANARHGESQMANGTSVPNTRSPKRSRAASSDAHRTKIPRADGPTTSDNPHYEVCIVVARLLLL